VLYCEHDPDRRALLLKHVGPLVGHGQIGKGRVRDGNTNSKPQSDQTYILARLKRDRPDLARQVIDGAVSVHAVAIEAGIRKRTKSIPIDTPTEALRALLRVLSVSELGEAFRALHTHTLGRVE
jgi:hypothetical protein